MKTLFGLVIAVATCILTIGCSNSTLAPVPPANSTPAAVSTVATTTVLSQGGKYTWQEAVKHIGETAIVTGPIIDSFDWRQLGLGENIILGMGITAFDGSSLGIPLDVDRAILPVDLYKGKIVSVAGVIGKKSFGDGANVAVTDLSQIRVISASSPSPQAEPDSLEVSGVIEQTRNTDTQVTEGGKLIAKGTVYHIYHGSLEGTSTSKYAMEIGLVDGKISMSAEGTFSGTINGMSGTFSTNETGIGQYFTKDTGVMAVKSVVLSGTGEPGATRGSYNTLTSLDPNGNKGVYSGRLSLPNKTAITTATPNSPAAGAQYTWEEAAKHLGEKATVTGTIIDSVDWKALGVGEDIALGMGKNIMDVSAFAVSLHVDRSLLPADLYKGKTISVTGTIAKRAFGDGALITVTDLSQIQERPEG